MAENSGDQRYFQNEKKEECTTRLDTKFETHYEEKCQEVKGGVISDGLFNLVIP